MFRRVLAVSNLTRISSVLLVAACLIPLQAVGGINDFLETIEAITSTKDTVQGVAEDMGELGSDASSAADAVKGDVNRATSEVSEISTWRIKPDSSRSVSGLESYYAALDAQIASCRGERDTTIREGYQRLYNDYLDQLKKGSGARDGSYENASSSRDIFFGLYDQLYGSMSLQYANEGKNCSSPTRAQLFDQLAQAMTPFLAATQQTVSPEGEIMRSWHLVPGQANFYGQEGSFATFDAYISACTGSRDPTVRNTYRRLYDEDIEGIRVEVDDEESPIVQHAVEMRDIFASTYGQLYKARLDAFSNNKEKCVQADRDKLFLAIEQSLGNRLAIE
jgi:hypothetical protein